MKKEAERILEGNEAEMEALKELPSVEECFRNAVSFINALRRYAAQGDESAIEALQKTGLLSAALLEGLFLKEQESGEEVGPVKRVSRRSTEWPQRLNAIKEIRTGKKATTWANAERYVKALELGHETEIDTDKTSAKGGNTREFQGKTGFASRMHKQIKHDLKKFENMTPAQIRRERYWSWNFNLDPALGPVVAMERPPSLHRLLQTYIEQARKMKPGSAADLTKVAMLCLRVEFEDDLERVNHWPEILEARKIKKDATYESRLREYLLAGFKSLLKK